MRLGIDEAETIRREVHQSDPAAEIYLFGSRTDDTARGGDIDLLVVSDNLAFRDVLQLRSRILDRIGWQQLDLVVRRRNELDEPLAVVALETGLKL
jgi:predicted nucleotidyltransferase